MKENPNNDAKNPMVNVINAGLIGIHETSNVLAALWRLSVYECNLKPAVWHRQLNSWLKKVAETTTSKELTSYRGNITRMLAKNKLSWSAFIKGQVILGFERMDIEIKLYRGKEVKIIRATIDDLEAEAKKMSKSLINSK